MMNLRHLKHSTGIESVVRQPPFGPTWQPICEWRAHRLNGSRGGALVGEAEPPLCARRQRGEDSLE